jgi:Flp pilus assembly protein TadG
MVEFALVGPLFFLLILGILILAIIVKNQIVLSSAVRDAARAAAVCGSTAGTTTSSLPDGTKCNQLQAYLNNKLASVDTSLADKGTFSVYDDSGGLKAGPSTAATANAVVAQCQAGVNATSGQPQSAYTVEVSVRYPQPLYVPLLGFFFGDSATNTRLITATGDATCEQ